MNTQKKKKNACTLCVHNYRKTMILKDVPAIPLIKADAFKWHRPCRTQPFTWKYNLIMIQRKMWGKIKKKKGKNILSIN